jgi:hypothetical protein
MRNGHALGHGSANAAVWHVLSMKKAEVPCEPALDVREPRPTKSIRRVATTSSNLLFAICYSLIP